MYSSPDFVRIASGDPARTHWTMHFRLSASLATEALLLRKRQAVSRTNPTIVPGLPIMSGGIGSDFCAWHSKATPTVPATIIVPTLRLDMVRVPPQYVNGCPGVQLSTYLTAETNRDCSALPETLLLARKV